MKKRKLQGHITDLASSAEHAGAAIDNAIAFVNASNARIDKMEARRADPERQKRQEAVNTARASIGLSGFDLSDEEEQRAQRYIDGEISLEEFVQGKVNP